MVSDWTKTSVEASRFRIWGRQREGEVAAVGGACQAWEHRGLPWGDEVIHPGPKPQILCFGLSATSHLSCTAHVHLLRTLPCPAPAPALCLAVPSTPLHLSPTAHAAPCQHSTRTCSEPRRAQRTFVSELHSACICSARIFCRLSSSGLGAGGSGWACRQFGRARQHT